EFAAAEGVSGPHHTAQAVVDGQQVGVAADDHFPRPVTGQVGDGDVRPDAHGAWSPPLETAICAVERHDVVGAPDHVRPAIAIEVRHGGGGIPPGLAGRAGEAAAVLPHED